MSTLDTLMNPDPDEEAHPALLSARNSALSVFDELFADEDDQNDAAVDSADMPQLRYSIGTNGDRQHLHRLAQDIHGAHKQADFRGLDLHRALREHARKDEASKQIEELCRIPAWRPPMTRAKSCGLLLPSLLPFKRKSEPPEKLRAALASPASFDSPPKPRKTVSFADLREDARAAAAMRSSRSSSPSADEDEDEEEYAAPPSAAWDGDLAHGHAQMEHWGEWGAQGEWGWEAPHVEQPQQQLPFAMAQPMMVQVMGPNGPYLMPAPQQMAAMVYPEFVGAPYHMEAAHAGYYAVPMMPQQMPPQMQQQMPHQMPPQMQQPMQQPMQQAQHLAWPAPMAAPPQAAAPWMHAGGQPLSYGSPPGPVPSSPPQHAAGYTTPPPASPPQQQHTPPPRSRAGAGDRAQQQQQHAPPAATGGRTRGALLAAAKEQQGSRRLQAELSRMSDAQLEAACAELAPHLLELATHTFGNYVVSKLAARPQAQPHLVAALRGHVVELLQHAQGSRVVQATLSALPAADAAALVDELDGHVLRCALDTHGSWGVCVAFKQTRAPFILAQMARNMQTLATQQHGIRVVQQVLNEAAACGMDLTAAVGALLEGELGFIAAHSYGNYSVQAALRHAAPAQREAMLAALLPSLLALSRSKHGSNVAEMVLMRASSAQIEQIHAQIFGADPRELRELMESPYGNYVLQALLRRLEPAQRPPALQRIEAQTASNNFGRAIIAAAAA